MEKEKIVGAVVGGIVAGFSIGVGFLIAQRTMGKWVNKKAQQEKDTISDAVKKGVSEGVQQANFAAMSGQQMKRRTQQFMGFDGQETKEWESTKFDSNPNSMSFSSEPTRMGSPNSSSLNVWG